MSVDVTELQIEDVPASARLHAEVLHMEFLARCGERFLRRYHRAWIKSSSGIALASHDDSGELVGVLLGALHPDAHFRSMVRRSGLDLAFGLVARAVSHPSFGWELVTTRGVRYVRGLTRMGSAALRRAARGRRRESTQSDTGLPVAVAGAATAKAKVKVVGEVTHVMVAPACQGKGVGRALLEQAAVRGRGAHLDELVLVTPPDLAAASVYDHLGWKREGSLTSKSGEAFVRFTLPLTE